MLAGFKSEPWPPSSRNRWPPCIGICKHDAQLARLGALAERYFGDDQVGCVGANSYRLTRTERKPRVAAFLRKGQEHRRVDMNLDPRLAAMFVISMIDGSRSIAIRAPKLDKKQSGRVLQTMPLRLLSPPATAMDA
jgi:hypothetical protein